MAQTLSGMLAKILDRVRSSRPAKPAAPAVSASQPPAERPPAAPKPTGGRPPAGTRPSSDSRPSSGGRPTSGRSTSGRSSGAPTSGRSSGAPTSGRSSGAPTSARPTSGGSNAPTVDDPSLAGVTFEYNPSLDGDADPGEVVWTWVPWEEDPSQGKDRPVLIVGRRKKMLVGVPLTSKAHDNERQVPVGPGPWDREGRPSYAKIERVLDVDPGQVRREGAILSRAHYDDVVTALRRN